MTQTTSSGGRHVPQRIAGNRACWLSVFALTLLVPVLTAAQEPTSSQAARTARQVVLDPTTYLPALLGYVSTQLDWNSSQVFFQQGMREHNSEFTISGLSDDVPIGYGAGNRRILKQSLLLIPTSLGNNAAAAVLERMLLQRFPSHPRLIRVVSRLERATFAAYISYRESSKHFRQWRMNNQQASQFGFR